MKLQTRISLYMVGTLTCIGLLVAIIVGTVSSRIITTSAETQLVERVGQLIDLIDAYKKQSEMLANYEMGALLTRTTGEWRRSTKDMQETAGQGFPSLKFNGKAINNDFSIPDDFLKKFGAVATVFVRHNGDFYRITTSLKKSDGTRAIGTPLGSNHPAFAALTKGEPFLGKASLFGRDYITKYQPIKDDTGEVIGALFVGVDFSDSLKALKDSIRKFKVGETGNVFAVDVGSSSSAGTFVIHSTEEGKNAFQMKDAATGALFLQDVSKLDNGLIRYSWDTPQRGRSIKYSAFKTYDPWKLQFHITVYEDDFMSIARQSAILVAVTMVIASLLMAAIAVWAVKRLVLIPLGGEPATAVQISASVANGDLTHKIAAAEGTLLGSLGKMQHSLSNMISRVMASTHTISERSETLSETMKKIDKNAKEQASAMSDSAASIEQLTVSIGEVSHIAEITEGKSKKVTELSSTGVNRIDTVVTHISQIAQSVQTTSSQIQVLQETTAKIDSVANTIKEIADQTTLLALNAAIEAARAGDQGRGFAVVADEVRRLAERTSVATADIAQMIGSIREENDRAVSEMSKISPVVEQSIATANEAAASLQDIHLEASGLLENAKEVSSATQEQAIAANSIAKNMEVVSGMSDQNTASVHEVTASTAHLDTVVTELRDQIATFKV